MTDGGWLQHTGAVRGKELWLFTDGFRAIRFADGLEGRGPWGRCAYLAWLFMGG
jgi:hypothetical protein